jgi:hypothetical protein
MKIFKKNRLSYQQKTIISSLIGVVTLIILAGILSLYDWFDWEDNFLRFLLPLKRWFYILIGGTIWEFSYLFTPLLSFLGIFLGVSSLNSPWRKLGIFAIALNSIDLIFALFIAWLLFGLARGM